jgi:hypothetical protein
MNTLVFYLFPNPAYIGQYSPFQIGWIDSVGALTNVTLSSTIEIIYPIAGATLFTNYIPTATGAVTVTGTEQNITLYLKVTYASNPPQYFSFCFVQPLPVIDKTILYRNYRSYLPKNVYTEKQYTLLADGTKIYDVNVYLKSNAIATTLLQLYDNAILTTIFQNVETPAFKDINTAVAAIYPSSGDPGWEQFLTGTNQLYLQNTAGFVTDYNSLLTLFYQTTINNDTNAYFEALNISKYIYFRLGIQKYVLIGEDNLDPTRGFILNLNELGRVIFNNGSNFPGVNGFTISVFIIDGNTLSSEFQLELNAFIRRITRASMLVNIYYNYTAAELGLTNINDTYWKDPRQDGIACIAYNPNVLAQALGYAGPLNDFAIIDYTLRVEDNIGNQMDLVSSTPGLPAPNALLLANSPYTVISITTTPAVPVVDLAALTQYYANNVTPLWDEYYPFSTLLSPTYNGVNEVLVLNSTGNLILNTYLGEVQNSYFITIS